MNPTEASDSGFTESRHPPSAASTVRDSVCPDPRHLRHGDVFSVDTNRPSGTLRATYYHGKDLKNVKFPPPGSTAITLPPLPDKHSTACFALVKKDGKISPQPLLLTHNAEPRPITGSVWSGILPCGKDRVKIFAAGFEGAVPKMTRPTTPEWMVLSETTSRLSLIPISSGGEGV